MPREGADVPLVDGVGPVEPLGQLLFPMASAARTRGRATRARARRAWDLVLQAGLEIVEGGRQVEDGAPVLHGHDASGREGPSVTDPVDLVEDRDVRSPGRRKYECNECTCPCSTVAPGGHEACPATDRPKTRWRSSLGWIPRKMLTSMGSRSSRSTRNSKDALIRPCSQAVAAGGAEHSATTPTTLRRRDSGQRAERRQRARVPGGLHLGVATAAHQIEGGNVNNDWWAWEHNRRRARSRRVATRVTPSTAGARTSNSWPIWASGHTASPSSGAV